RGINFAGAFPNRRGCDFNYRPAPILAHDQSALPGNDFARAQRPKNWPCFMVVRCAVCSKEFYLPVRQRFTAFRPETANFIELLISEHDRLSRGIGNDHPGGHLANDRLEPRALLLRIRARLSLPDQQLCLLSLGLLSIAYISQNGPANPLLILRASDGNRRKMHM